MAHQYKVTLNFTFTPQVLNECSGDDISPYQRRMREAYKRTDDYYKNNSVVDYIKSFRAHELVQYLADPFGSVVSAEWDPNEFQIHMLVATNHKKKKLLEDLEFANLEDGEYEAPHDNGWVLLNRDENNQSFDPRIHSIYDFWHWGYLDYRSNPIDVEALK